MWKPLSGRLAIQGRGLALAGAAVATALAGGAALMTPGVAPRVLAQVESIADALDRRSPGERQVGELTKVKGVKGELPGLAESLGPQQRALGKVFPPGEDAISRPLAFGEPELSSPGSLVGPLALVSIPQGTLAIGSPPGSGFGPPGGVFGPPGSGGIILPPPGGGTIVAPPGGGTAVLPPPDVPAVPEPSTWVVLIIGFAFCAGAMRRRRSSVALGEAQCTTG